MLKDLLVKMQTIKDFIAYNSMHDLNYVLVYELLKSNKFFVYFSNVFNNCLEKMKKSFWPNYTKAGLYNG